MNTLAEIEAAADTLLDDEKEELVRYLVARIHPPGSTISPTPKSLLGAWQELVTFRQGWKEPLEVMRPCAK